MIHGIGEQRPMETLRQFVKAVWETDEDVKHPYAVANSFSKPDRLSDTFELRRLTTTKNRNDVRTDFYEFYWAHLMEGTSLGHVVGWARRLLFRDPRTLPRQLLSSWAILVITVAAAAVIALQTLLPPELRILPLAPWVYPLLSGAAALLIVPIIRNVVGDAARYLDPAPTNVGRRQVIRAAGVRILRQLHLARASAGGTEPEYDRIVIVGHSLGSVIGYDMLTHAWDSLNTEEVEPAAEAALNQIEGLVAHPPIDRTVYRDLQRKLSKKLREHGHPWRVTDFVTLGSPLAHAQVLLAQNEKDLREKQRSRELPTCPPVLEGAEPDGFSYRIRGTGARRLHHAAVFGPTRWTNLYFPSRRLGFGDLVGGPVAPAFLSGVQDEAVATTIRGGWLSHTVYWKLEEPGPGSHVEALRRALNLLDE